MARSAVCVWLCLLAMLCKQASGVIKVDTSSQQLIDEEGRVRFFHGVNAVYKVFPWVPPTGAFDPLNSLSREDVANLTQWGFNFVRLGVMWPGVEPALGVFNQTYLDEIADLINMLGDAGIYVLVDAHQDLFSRFYCGEGAPDWAVAHMKPREAFPHPVLNHTLANDTNGMPLINECLQTEFAKYYFTDAVGASFQSLFTNGTLLNTHFKMFWDVVSKRFASFSNVIGFELINEPWPGDIYAHPQLLFPGVADKTNLDPFYKDLHQVIRKNDDEHIIFFEKSLVDIFGAVGMPSGPGGPAYNDRQVLSYHIYCSPTTRSGDPSNIIECDGENTLEYDLAMGDFKKLGTGGFMTEFGAVGNAPKSAESLTWLAVAADSNLQSWSYWQFKYFQDLTTSGSAEALYDDSGMLEETKLKALSRTYPTAVAGMPVSFSFDAYSSSFQFIYTLNASIPLPTEIYLNEALYYPSGYTVTLTPSSAVTWTSPSTNSIHIQATSIQHSGIEVQVGIQKK
eukprot:TRINITY_DN4550_c0_g1_i1.p1 TRINITY_DN4550_c0_g1~~TRINITY_DN4550_c0_g1_i1.p1  ORF type:complete len:510 (-),score=124.90 TRINITY_DN4550_c0_g1_i1:11-1540(-)